MNKYKLFGTVFWLVVGLVFFLAYQEQKFAKSPSFDVNIETNSVLNFDSKQLAVSIENTSKNPVTDLTVEITVGTNVVDKKSLATLAASEKRELLFTIPVTAAQNLSPVVTRIGYTSQGDRLGTLNLNEWRKVEGATPLAAQCPSESLKILSRKNLFIEHLDNASANIFLPEGFALESLSKTARGTNFLLRNLHALRNSTLTAFLVIEPQVSTTSVSPLVCPLKLGATGIQRERSDLAITPLECFALAFIGLVIAIITYRLSCRLEYLSPWRIAVVRWAFTIFIVASFYTFYAAAPQMSAILTWYLNGWRETLSPGRALPVGWLAQGIAFFEFSGNNYQFFNNYCLHPLLLYTLSLNLLTIRYLINPDPFNDKYWHLFLKCAASFPTNQSFVCSESPAPNEADSTLVKMAVLSLLVKAFFLPVFLSWTIGNIFHADFLLKQNSWDFFSINSLVVHLIITVDVLVFAFGYLVELPLLKNQIKSVESTLTGWLLCIICYPPINTWIFRGLDAPLTSTWSGVSPNTSKFFLVLITLLWAIYAWATLALGFKASNLTNRGIVTSGPYRYVRHPAYISKLILWTIAGLFLAQFNFLLVIAFWVVYWGRAVTEERHLSKDSDYQEYVAKVPWRFLPGIY